MSAEIVSDQSVEAEVMVDESPRPEAELSLRQRIVRLEIVDSPFSAVRRFHKDKAKLETTEVEFERLEAIEHPDFREEDEKGRKSAEVHDLTREVAKGPGIRRRAVIFNSERLSVPITSARMRKRERSKEQSGNGAGRESRSAIPEIATANQDLEPIEVRIEE